MSAGYRIAEDHARLGWVLIAPDGRRIGRLNQETLQRSPRPPSEVYRDWWMTNVRQDQLAQEGRPCTTST